MLSPWRCHHYVCLQLADIFAAKPDNQQKPSLSGSRQGTMPKTTKLWNEK